MKYRNRIITVLLILCVIFAALYFIPISRNVDMFLPCVMWELDNPTAGETEGMEIKGKYYDYLIKADKFKGSILISEVNQYEEEQNMEMFVFQVGDIKTGSINYYSQTYNRFVYIGSMYMQGWFDKMFIALYVDEKSPLNGKYLCAPATTIEEAVAIAEAMNFA